jgi:hypothetical protein
MIFIIPTGLLCDIHVCFFRFGKVLIIQEADNIDPVLFPILRGDFINQGENLKIGL